MVDTRLTAGGGGSDDDGDDDYQGWTGSEDDRGGFDDSDPDEEYLDVESDDSDDDDGGSTSSTSSSEDDDGGGGSTSSTTSSTRFGEELGGDPAGDADRETGTDDRDASQPPGGGPETVEDPQTTTDDANGTTDGGPDRTDAQPPGAGPETIEDREPPTDTTPPPTPDDGGPNRTDAQPPGGGPETGEASDDGRDASQPPGAGPETIEDSGPSREDADRDTGTTGPDRTAAQPPGAGPETIEDSGPTREDTRRVASQPPGAGPETVEGDAPAPEDAQMRGETDAGVQEQDPSDVERRPAEADADPDAYTGVTREELLESEDVQQFIDRTGVDPEAIVFDAEVDTDAPGNLRWTAQVTPAGRRQIAAGQIEQQLAGPTEQVGDLRVPTGLIAGTGVAVDLTAEDIVETEEGFTLTEEAFERVQDEFGTGEVPAGPSRSQRDEAARELEAAYEEQLRQQELDARGIYNPTLRAGAGGGPDLDFGAEDIVLTPVETETIDTDTGERTRQRFTVQLTESGLEQVTAAERDIAETAIAGQLTREYNAPFFPGEQFELVETEEGYGAELTEEGEVLARTSDLSPAVRRFEERTGIDVPGEGPLTDTFEEQDLGTGAQAITVRVGRDEELVTIEEALGAGADAIREATAIQGPAIEAMEPTRGRAGAAARVEQDAFTGAGYQPVAQASASILQTPAFLLEGTNLLIDAAEFQYDVTRAVIERDEERLNELNENVNTAFRQTAAMAGATAARDPGEFVARGVGSLNGTGLLMGGAAAVSSRAGLATRALIQPGEEAAGYGLHYGARGAGRAVGRPEAGQRAADVIAPNQEPLIFSEEAALQRSAQAARYSRMQAGRAASRARLETTAARFRMAEIASRDVPTRPGTARQRLRQERKAAEFEVAEVNPFSDVRRPRTGRGYDRGQVTMALPARRRGRTRSRSETEGATDPELDAEASAQRVRQRFEEDLDSDLPTEVEAEVAAEAPARVRFQPAGTEEEALERARVATEPHVGVEEAIEERVEQRPLERLRQEFETEGRELEFETELERTDTRIEQRPVEVAAEAEAELETELEFESEFETEFELEFEPGETGRDRRRRRRRFEYFDAEALTRTGILSAEEVAELSDLDGFSY